MTQRHSTTTHTLTVLAALNEAGALNVRVGKDDEYTAERCLEDAKALHYFLQNTIPSLTWDKLRELMVQHPPEAMRGTP